VDLLEQYECILLEALESSVNEDVFSCALYLLELGTDLNEVGKSEMYPIVASAQGLKDPMKMVQAQGECQCER
jgi:hypothetical protein